MTLDPDQLIGTTIGPYTLDRLIGQGGFAWVFAGQKDGEAPVALKVLKPRYAGDAASAYCPTRRSRSLVTASAIMPSRITMPS